jgi:hypothetical protein
MRQHGSMDPVEALRDLSVGQLPAVNSTVENVV